MSLCQEPHSAAGAAGPELQRVLADNRSSDGEIEVDFDNMDPATLWRLHEFCNRHMPGPLPGKWQSEQDREQEQDPDEHPGEQDDESDDDESGSDLDRI